MSAPKNEMARILDSDSFSTAESMVKKYAGWATAYDKDIGDSGWTGPQITAKMVDKYLGGKKDVKILDVGAGTGLVGAQLKDLGYTDIDALDPVHEMLQVAKEKNCYKNFHEIFLSGENCGLMEGTYDIICSSGAFGNNHMPIESFVEMIRLTKKGGMIVVICNLKFLSEEKAGLDGFETLVEKLESEGKWRCLRKTHETGYWEGNTALCMVYEVC